MIIDFNNKKFQKLLVNYVKWIDNPPMETKGDYDFFRKKEHQNLFDFFKILRHSSDGDKLELYINKFIISMSKNLHNKELAMLASCKSQEELDLFEKKMQFINKFTKTKEAIKEGEK